MTVWIGTSGWQYDHWRGGLYPPEVPKRRWLEHYAARFRVVEVNNTFYRLPAPDTFRAWAERTPDDFVVAVKASRFLTHVKRLRDPDEPVGRLLEHAAPLGAKLGPVLLQLPPNMAVEAERLDATLSAFPRRLRIAVEPRDPRWDVPDVRAVLRDHDAAWCLADRRSRPTTRLWRTASWGYVRFHVGAGSPTPCYGDTALRSWARRIATLWHADADVYAFFNNDPAGCAVRDARRFAVACERRGLATTRVPSPAECHLPPVSSAPQS